MPNFQKGFAAIILLPLLLLLIGGVAGGYFINQNLNSKTSFSNKPTSSATVKPLSTPTTNPTNTPQNTNDLLKYLPSKEVLDTWKDLEIKSCSIKLKYPPDWDIFENYQEGNSCSLVISNKKTETNSSYRDFFIKTLTTQEANKEEEQRQMSLKQSNIEDDRRSQSFIAEGAAKSVVYILKKTKRIGYFRIDKGNTAFIGGSNYKPEDSLAQSEVLGILNSIKFTAEEHAYLNPIEDFDSRLKINSIYQLNAGTLRLAIERYAHEKGMYPNTLEELVRSGYYAGSDKYNDPSLYEYKVSGDTFTISVKLLNGEIYSETGSKY